MKRFEEAKTLLRKIMPVARRILGDSQELTLQIRANYATALCNAAATLDDLHEGVTTFEDVERIARHVLGRAHPLTVEIEGDVRTARAMLRARETPPPSGSA